jgi:pimeloyl-ACP methyl ester carboxylesterase
VDVMPIGEDRLLEYVEVGDPAGQPVVLLHGTPATAGYAVLYDEAARSSGVRLVAFSRPGYGASTMTAPGLLRTGADVDALANALGIDTFGALGVSGGGPFALAVGAALPTRVRSIVVAGGPGPYHQVAPQMLEPEDLEGIELLAAGDVDAALATVTVSAQRAYGEMAALPTSEFEAAFSAGGPPTEHYFEERPEQRAVFFADLHRAFGSFDGFVRDNLSWCGPWDFDLADVAALVRLSYGRKDAICPVAHGAWLHERLRTSQLTVHPDAAHGEVCTGLAQWSLGVLTES